MVSWKPWGVSTDLVDDRFRAGGGGQRGARVLKEGRGRERARETQREREREKQREREREQAAIKPYAQITLKP